MEKRGKFDYILLETTGLADPSPIASMFWLDDELGSDVFLDGIVTLVDAKHGLEALQTHAEDGLLSAAMQQVALADVILLNKTDLVANDVQKLNSFEETLRSMNAAAAIHRTSRSTVNLDLVLKYTIVVISN